MSNLGWYQTFTTISKKIGGPLNLIATAACLGVGIGIGIDEGCRFVVRRATQKRKNMFDKKRLPEDEDLVYTVTEEATNNEGVQFMKGSKIRLLQIDKDACLIELIGDDNNPYFVSKAFLESISNYK